jgi:hypothetical protein
LGAAVVVEWSVWSYVGEVVADLGGGGAEGHESADDAVGPVFEVEEHDGALFLDELESGDEGEPGLAGFGFAGDGVDGAVVEEGDAVGSAEHGGWWVEVVAGEDLLEVDGCPGGGDGEAGEVVAGLGHGGGGVVEGLVDVGVGAG